MALRDKVMRCPETLDLALGRLDALAQLVDLDVSSSVRDRRYPLYLAESLQSSPAIVLAMRADFSPFCVVRRW
jgi:hypothetical protein